MTVAASTRALWYLSRGTGVAALLLLTATLLLGVLGVARWRTRNLPRFLLQGLHRNLTLLSVAFVALHVLTTIADGFAPIGLLDAVIPFASPYRPFWLGLGTVAFDLLLALTLTSLLRARIGARLWRGLHWLAYAAWPIALVHSLGTGSDARVGWLQTLAVACTAAVAGAALWRALSGEPDTVRIGAAAASVLVPLGLAIWYVGGPGAAGWAARAGTPSQLLARTAQALPFRPASGHVTGTIVRSRPSAGVVTVRIAALHGAEHVGVWLRGGALASGGVSVSSSRMWIGTATSPALYVGTLSSLDGSRMSAVLVSAAGARVPVSLRLQIDRAHGRVTGTLRAGAVR